MATLAVHGALLAGTVALVNKHVSEPYMDEIFHIPQAQRFCSNDFITWDPKLTTPPGLYLVSRVLGAISGGYFCNNVEGLRAINIAFSMGLYLVLHQLISIIHPNATPGSQRLYALALVWLPVLNFFNFLYYTDAGSAFFVFLSYLFVKQKRYTSAGLSGLCSLTFRQTNIVWVGVFMALAVIDIVDTADPSPASSIRSIGPVVDAVKDLIIGACKQLPNIARRLAVFLVCVVGFGVFLVWNKGIVLGDKANHTAGFHFPQLFYFSIFLSFFGAPWILTVAKALPTFWRCLRRPTLRSCLLTISVSCLMFYLIYRFTYEHPFLLSDNRHYAFYVWRKILNRYPIMRYLALPAYIISGWFNIYALACHTSVLLFLGYFAAIFATLVPSPLLEFRYFIVPFLFYCVQIGPPKADKQWLTWIVLVIYAVIHVATIYMFLYRPFVWSHEPDQMQRFMW
ncbi:alpha-2-glucosyltransferase Alg10 [Dichotomocladium elegans]|nr:alpha-2-glucosyltransferase Alg10 [Dichotomocladium elegans]